MSRQRSRRSPAAAPRRRRAAGRTLPSSESLADRQRACGRRGHDDFLAARHLGVKELAGVVAELHLAADGAVELTDAHVGDARVGELLGCQLRWRQAFLTGDRRKTVNAVVNAQGQQSGQYHACGERALRAARSLTRETNLRLLPPPRELFAIIPGRGPRDAGKSAHVSSPQSISADVTSQFRTND